jgi:hypothetical protein
MWIFTIDGFYSVVQHRDHPEEMVVRARVEADLERMLTRLRHRTFETTIPIEHTPEGDYAYRCFLTKNEWALYLSRAVEATDYPNFKDEVAKRLGHDRADVYLDVWLTMMALQHG